MALVAAACGDGGGDGTDAPVREPDRVDRDLGFVHVEPISALVAELFNGPNPDVAITVEGPGTGDGFELFCQGRVRVADASRPIDEEEVAACEDGGIAYQELEVASTGSP